MGVEVGHVVLWVRSLNFTISTVTTRALVENTPDDNSVPTRTFRHYLYSPVTCSESPVFRCPIPDVT